MVDKILDILSQVSDAIPSSESIGVWAGVAVAFAYNLIRRLWPTVNPGGFFTDLSGGVKRLIDFLNKLKAQSAIAISLLVEALKKIDALLALGIPQNIKAPDAPKE